MNYLNALLLVIILIIVSHSSRTLSRLDDMESKISAERFNAEMILSGGIAGDKRTAAEILNALSRIDGGAGEGNRETKRIYYYKKESGE